ncbi:MAG: 2-phospho-L-lactate guanylyltransferase [Burkholderiales bacterium]
MEPDGEFAKRIFAVIPVKDPDLGKSRLSPLLDQSQRRALNLMWARHTFEVCTAYLGAERTIVVSSSIDIRQIATQLGARVLDEVENACGMNGALRAGAKFAVDSGAKAVVAIPTDLPFLSILLLRRALAHLPVRNGCLLVPDRRGTGTNLMAISPVDPTLFSFGEPSLERHTREARKRRYRVQIHRSAALSVDIDVPDDLRYLRDTDEFEASAANWSLAANANH